MLPPPWPLHACTVVPPLHHSGVILSVGHLTTLARFTNTQVTTTGMPDYQFIFGTGWNTGRVCCDFILNAHFH